MEQSDTFALFASAALSHNALMGVRAAERVGKN